MARGDFNISFDSNISTFTSELNKKIQAAKSDIRGLAEVVEELDSRLASGGSKKGGSSNLRGLIAELNSGLDRAAKGFSAEFGKASGSFQSAAKAIDSSVAGLDTVTKRLDSVVEQMRYVARSRNVAAGANDSSIKNLNDRDVAAAGVAKAQAGRISDASKALDRINRLSETLAKRAGEAGDRVKYVNAELGNLNKTLGKMKFPAIEVPETIKLSGVRFVAQDGSVISGAFGTDASRAAGGEGDPARVQRVAEAAATQASDAVAAVAREVGKVTAQPGKAVDPVRQEFLSQMRNLVQQTAVTADRDVLDKSFQSGTSGRTNYTVSDLELSGSHAGALVESGKELEKAQKDAAAKARLVRDAEERLARAQQAMAIASETGASGRSLGAYKGAVTKVVKELETLQEDAKKAQNVLRNAEDIASNARAQRTSDVTVIPRGTNYGDSSQRSYGSIIGPGGIPPSRIEAAFAAVGVANQTRREESLSATAGFLDQRPLATLAEFAPGKGATDIQREAAKSVRASLRILDETIIETLQQKANEGRPLSSQESQSLYGAQQRQAEREAATTRATSSSAVRESLFGEGALPGASANLNRVYRQNYSPEDIPGLATANPEDKAKILANVQKLKRAMQSVVSQTMKAIAEGADPDQAYAGGRAKVQSAYENVFGKVQQVGNDFQGRFTPGQASDAVYTQQSPRDLLYKQAQTEGLGPLREKLTGLGGTLPEGLGYKGELQKLISDILKLENAARKAAGVTGQQQALPAQEKKAAEEALVLARGLGNLRDAAARARAEITRSYSGSSTLKSSQIEQPTNIGTDYNTGQPYYGPITKQQQDTYLERKSIQQAREKVAGAGVSDADLATAQVATQLKVSAKDLPRDLKQLDLVVKEYIRALESGATVAQAQARALDPRSYSTRGATGVQLASVPRNLPLDYATGSNLSVRGTLDDLGPTVAGTKGDENAQAERLIIRINGKIQGYVDYVVSKLEDGTRAVTTNRAYISPEARGKGGYEAAQTFLATQGDVVDHGPLTAQGRAALQRYTSGPDAIGTHAAESGTATGLVGSEEEKILADLRKTLDTDRQVAKTNATSQKKSSEKRKGMLKRLDAEAKRLKAEIVANPGDADLEAQLAKIEKEIAEARKANKYSGGSGSGGSGGSLGGASSKGKSGAVDVRLVDINGSAISKLKGLVGSGGSSAEQSKVDKEANDARRVLAETTRQSRAQTATQVAAQGGLDPAVLKAQGVAKDFAALGAAAARLSAAGLDSRDARGVVASASGVDQKLLAIPQREATAAASTVSGLGREAKQAASGMLKETVDLFENLRRAIQSGETTPRAAAVQASAAAQLDPSLAGAAPKTQKQVIAQALGIGAGNSTLMKDAYKAGQQAAQAAQQGALSKAEGPRGQISQALGFRNAEGESTFSNRVTGAAGNFFVRDIAAGAYFSIANNIQQAVKAGLEAESTFVRVSAALESTGRSAEGMRTSLQQTSVQTATSLADVYEIAAQLTGVFSDVADIELATNLIAQLQLISGGALNATEGFRSLSAVTSAYGLEGVDSLTHVADTATYLQNTIGVNIEDTLEGAARLAPIAEQLGITFEEVSTIVGEAGKKTGQTGQIASEQVGRILSRFQEASNQEFLINIGVGSKEQFASGKTGDVLKELFAKFDQFQPEVQDKILKTFGGTREAATAAALFSDGTTLLKVMEGATNSFGTTAARTAALVNTLKVQLQLLGKNFANLAALVIRAGFLDGIGAMVILLNKALSLINTIGSKLIDTFDNIPGGEAFRRLIAGAAGLLVILKLLKPALASVFSLTGTATPAALTGPAPSIKGALTAATGAVTGTVARPAPPIGLTREQAAAQPTRYSATGGTLIPTDSKQNVLGRVLASTGAPLTKFGEKLGTAADDISRKGTVASTVMGKASNGLVRLGGSMSQMTIQTDQASKSTRAAAGVMSGFNTAMFAAAIAIPLIVDGLNAISSNSELVKSTLDKEAEAKLTEGEQASAAATSAIADPSFSYKVGAFITGQAGPQTSAGIALKTAIGKIPGLGAVTPDPGAYSNAYSFDINAADQASIDATLSTAIGADSSLRTKKYGFGLADPTSAEERKKFLKAEGRRVEEANAKIAEVNEEEDRVLDKMKADGANSAQQEAAAKQFADIKAGLGTIAANAEAKILGINQLNLIAAEKIDDLGNAITGIGTLDAATFNRNKRYYKKQIENLALPDKFQGTAAYTDYKLGDLGLRGSKASGTFTETRVAATAGIEDKAFDPKLELRTRLKNQLKLQTAAAKSAQVELDKYVVGTEEYDTANAVVQSAIQLQTDLEQKIRELAATYGSFADFFSSIGSTDKAMEYANKAVKAADNAVTKYLADGGSRTDQQFIDLLQQRQEARARLAQTLAAGDTARLTIALSQTQDPIDQARIALKQAQEALQIAKDSGLKGNALADLIAAVNQAKTAFAEAQQAEAAQIASAEASTIQDPVAKAKADLANALSAAADTAGQGAGAQAQADAAVVTARQAYVKALEAQAQAAFGLKEATATAEGRVIVAANIQLRAAQDALAAAQQTGDKTAILQAQANLVTTEAALRDLQLSERIDTIDFRKEMGRITAQEEIAALQRLLRERDLTKQQRRDLLLKIKGLKDDLNSDLTGSGFNIGDISLPTAYQVRRSLGIDPVNGGNGTGNTTVTNTTNNQQRVEMKNEFQVMNQAQAEQIAKRVARMISDQMDRQARSSGSSPRLV